MVWVVSDFLAFCTLFVVALRAEKCKLLIAAGVGVLSSSERKLLPFVIRSMQYSAVKAEMSSKDVGSFDLVPFRIMRTASWPHFLI